MGGDVQRGATTAQIGRLPTYAFKAPAPASAPAGEGGESYEELLALQVRGYTVIRTC